jgi:hypothetical protein
VFISDLTKYKIRWFFVVGTFILVIFKQETGKETESCVAYCSKNHHSLFLGIVQLVLVTQVSAQEIGMLIVYEVAQGEYASFSLLGSGYMCSFCYTVH